MNLIPQNILSRISQDTEVGCWKWTGKVQKNQGRFYGVLPDYISSSTVAHRIIYALLIGEPGEVLIKSVSCIELCVNPYHFSSMTISEQLSLQQTKPFCKYGHEYTDKNTYIRKDGQGRQCRQCNLARQMVIYWKDPKSSHDRINESRRSDNPPPSSIYNREKALKNTYNMSMDDYWERLESQNGGCAICGTIEPGANTFSIDHDHNCCPGIKSCGLCIRGLLCRLCNTGLGMFRDNPKNLGNAVEYLNGKN